MALPRQHPTPARLASPPGLVRGGCGVGVGVHRANRHARPLLATGDALALSTSAYAARAPTRPSIPARFVPKQRKHCGSRLFCAFLSNPFCTIGSLWFFLEYPKKHFNRKLDVLLNKSGLQNQLQNHCVRNPEESNQVFDYVIIGWLL